jgi:hypothetical protein
MEHMSMTSINRSMQVRQSYFSLLSTGRLDFTDRNTQIMLSNSAWYACPTKPEKYTAA